MGNRLICIGTRAVVVMMISLSVLSLSYAHERTPDSVIEKNSAVEMKPEDGFLGLLWGTRSEAFTDARLITDLTPGLKIYSVDLDVSPIIGTVPANSCLKLIFSKERGLEQAHIGFDAAEYDRVEQRLNRLFGERSPVIYELMASRDDFLKHAEWIAGPNSNTRIVLLLRSTGASLEISKRDFALPEGLSITAKIAETMIKQAEEYDRKNRIVEASSVYQTLLNSTDSYQSFTQTAMERLATYSSLNGAVEYLGEDDGFAFYGFKNIFTDCSGQQWVRINLSATVQGELRKQRPIEMESQNELGNMSAVMCRVRIIAATGELSVVEQIWLNSFNGIIGVRSARAPQDVGWPGPYIKQVCETFLRAWFSVEHISKEEVL